MFTNGKLYTNEAGCIVHVHTDGIMVEYPGFMEFAESELMQNQRENLEEELPLSWIKNFSLQDDLYLARQVFTSDVRLCLVSDCKRFMYDILDGMWFMTNRGDDTYNLFSLPNLIVGHEYNVLGHRTKLSYFSENTKEFVFEDADSNIMYIPIEKSCDIEE